MLPDVPPVKVAALARYGLGAKAPASRELSATRRAATLLATVRKLEIDAVDDALDLFDLLMATKLLAKAERSSNGASELTASASARGDVIENGQIHLDRLGPAPETPGLQRARGEMARMMPRVDLPEVLLEIFAGTGVVDCFTHISGATTRMDELEVSLCAVLLSEAANFGLRPVINPAVRALTRGRLRHVDAAYKRLETISAANARFIACQARS
ncbi:MAG: Tn3 family transposase [Solirubrobacteraceae bacterium]